MRLSLFITRRSLSRRSLSSPRSSEVRRNRSLAFSARHSSCGSTGDRRNRRFSASTSSSAWVVSVAARFKTELETGLSNSRKAERYDGGVPERGAKSFAVDNWLAFPPDYTHRVERR